MVQQWCKCRCWVMAAAMVVVAAVAAAAAAAVKETSKHAVYAMRI